MGAFESSLPRNESQPPLLWRSCDQWLTNFRIFRALTTESRSHFERGETVRSFTEVSLRHRHAKPPPPKNNVGMVHLLWMNKHQHCVRGGEGEVERDHKLGKVQSVQRLLTKIVDCIFQTRLFSLPLFGRFLKRIPSRPPSHSVPNPSLPYPTRIPYEPRSSFFLLPSLFCSTRFEHLIFDFVVHLHPH